MNTGLFTLGAVIVALSVYGYFGPYDDTDDAINKERSGLSLYTDHGTGCQYLVKLDLFAVAITPRMRHDGSQVCSQ